MSNTIYIAILRLYLLGEERGSIDHKKQFGIFFFLTTKLGNK